MNGVIVMLRILSYAVYIFLQCTWGIIQTLMGLVYFLISMRRGMGGQTGRENFKVNISTVCFKETLINLLIGVWGVGRSHTFRHFRLAPNFKILFIQCFFNLIYYLKIVAA